MSQFAAPTASGLGAVETALLALVSPDRCMLAPPAHLPPGAIDLIRAAAGDREHVVLLAQRHGVDVRAIDDAALYFVHSVMFHPDSDHFRVLGARPGDDEGTLKLHFRWLQKWLHPDRDPEGWTSVYSERVNTAWAQLRRADRREQYRESLADDAGAVTQGRARAIVRTEHVDLAGPFAARAPLMHSRWLRRLPAVMVGGTLALAAGLFVAHRVGEGMLADERARALLGAKTAPNGSALTGPMPLQMGEEEWENEGADAGMPDAPSDLAAGASGESLTGALVDSTPALADDADAPTVAALGETRVGKGLVQPIDVFASVGGGNPLDVRAAEQIETLASEGRLAAAPSQGASSSGVVSDRARSAARHQEQRADDSYGMQASDQASSGEWIAVSAAPAGRRPVNRLAAKSVEDADVPGPVQQPAPKLPEATASASGSVPTLSAVAPSTAEAPQADSGFDATVGRRLLNQFSKAYQSGEVQQVVVLFAPNARTPEGNLLDLHGHYSNLFASSSRRSLEYIDVEWRALGNSIEGTGTFEWALTERTRTKTESHSGPMRVVIEFVDGRPLIAVLEHRDFG